MTRKRKIIGTHLLLFGALLLGLTVKLPPKRIAPDYLYPNSKYTPGVADTLNVNDLTARYNDKTYSQYHRNVLPKTRKLVMSEYPNTMGAQELDHFYPLCAGGSNDAKNLWVQPAQNMWNGKYYGFHEKDKLEAWVCEQIKSGKLQPVEAFKKLTGDWVAYYNEVFKNEVKVGSLPSEDNDDEEWLP